MPDSTPLDPADVAASCLGVLADYGYVRQPEPLRIVELSFEFDAVFAGPGDHHALVLLVDQPAGNLDAVQRRLTSLAIALSRSGSRRPVAVVLVAPPLDSQALEALRPLARLVVVAREEQTPETVAEALRVFRPLNMDDLDAPRPGAVKELRLALGDAADNKAEKRLLSAAPDGEEAVDRAFRELLAEALSGPAPSAS